MTPVLPLTFVDVVVVPERGWLFFLVLTVLTLAVAAVLLVLIELLVRVIAMRQPWAAVPR